MKVLTILALSLLFPFVTNSNTNSVTNELVIVVPDRSKPVTKVKPKRTYYATNKTEAKQIGTIAFINPNIGSRFKIKGPLNPAIHDAVENYTGPLMEPTSGLRFWNRKSKHAAGKALDVDLSYSVANYLVTEEGQAWLNKYGLKFCIEDKSWTKEMQSYRAEKFQPYIFINPNATGSHIHIELK